MNTNKHRAKIQKNFNYTFNFRKLMKLKKLKDNGPATWNSSQGFFKKEECCPLTPETSVTLHHQEHCSVP